MQRVLVMGPPGSGKSTLARYLSRKQNLPVFHLDQFFHQPGWVPTPPEVFQAEVARIAALPEWVIDGNYTDTIAPRFSNADTVIYLDIPCWLSMFRIIRRSIIGYGQVRQDGPAGCPERFTFEFLHFVWTWNRDRRARSLSLVNGFAGDRIILRGARAQRRFIRQLDLDTLGNSRLD